MEYKKRLTVPSKNNKYYYSNNVFYKSGYGMPNCTCYAWGRFLEENNITDYAILSRYNHDLKKFSKHKFPGNYEFMSVHQSKGLGFNNVIIIKMSNDKYGFPSNIKNDYLTSLIIDTDFYIEERRLFYVALTRTKNKVYILVPKFTPSSFINEIIKYKGVKIKKY